MDKRKVMAAGGLLGMLLLVAFSLSAADEVTCDMPNPFAPVAIHTESTGAKWRHGFHKMRVTWDKYFEVYPKELDNFDSTTLDKIKANPTFFLDRKVRFDLYYGRDGSIFRPFTTPFNQDTHLNFSAWSYSADLWSKEGRGSIHPLFYIDRRREKMIQKLDHLPMYTPIHVWAWVRSKSEGLAWMEVMGFEIIPEVVQTDASLRHIELGATQYNKKRYDLASQALDVAVKLELPVQVEVKVFSLLGRAYYEQRLYNHARNAFVNAVLRDDSNVSNLVMLARTDLRLDRPDEAKQSASRAITLEPSNAEARAELGLALGVLGATLDAYKELDYALKLAPRGQLPEAFRNLAMVAVLEGKLTMAADELSKALVLRPTDYLLHLEMGDVRVAQNLLDKALLEYTQARELAAHRPEPYFKVASVLKMQGDALAKENKPEDAKKLYEEALGNVRQAIGKDPHFLPAYTLEVELLRALNKEAEIKASLERGAKANPKSPVLQELFFEQAKVENDFVGMERAARAALAIKVSPEAYSRLGWVLSSKPAPDHADAAEAYAQAVQLDIERGADWATLGSIRVYHLNDAAGAEAALLQAVELQPQNANAWYDLAYARRAQGNVTEALAAADTAAKLSATPKTNLLAAQLHLDRHQKGDPEAAAELARAAAADATDEATKTQAQATLGIALTHAGSIEAALEAFRAAQAGNRDNAEFNLWYGVALMKNAEFEAAEQKLSAALEQLQPVATQSELNRRLERDAQKALRRVAKLKADPNAIRSQPETVKNETPDTKIDDGSTAKKLPPVIEDDEEKAPVPIEVPGTR